VLKSSSVQTTGKKKKEPRKLTRPSQSSLKEIRPFSKPTTKESSTKKSKTSGTTKEEIPLLDQLVKTQTEPGGDHLLQKAVQASRSSKQQKLLQNELRGCMTNPTGTRLRNRTKAIYGLVHSPQLPSSGKQSTTYTNKILQVSLLNAALTSGNKWTQESGTQYYEGWKPTKDSHGAS